jgi:ATP-dependent DNA ligase
LRAEAAEHAKFVVTGIARGLSSRGNENQFLFGPGWLSPRSRSQHQPPSGPDLVHEIKRDGYRIIVRRDGAAVRLHSRNANDWTARLRAIEDGAQRIKAKRFTIDSGRLCSGLTACDLPRRDRRGICHKKWGL